MRKSSREKGRKYWMKKLYQTIRNCDKCVHYISQLFCFIKKLKIYENVSSFWEKSITKLILNLEEKNLGQNGVEFQEKSIERNHKIG